MVNPSRQRAGANAERNPNVFDDEYEVDVPETELDHRPLERSAGQEPETSTRIRSQTPSSGGRAERRSIANKEASESSTPQRTWRRSIAKDPRDFVNAGSTGTRTPSSNQERQSGFRTRPISTASEFAPFEDRSSTPVNGRNNGVDGFSGFSQSGLPRSSFASHSPSRRQSTHTQARPAQPYGLYNQTGLGADDDSEPPVPVGFLGRGDNFERRIGPDGEEQDIVGPDGHTEQLPPYSKYPDGHQKIAAADVASIPAGTRTLSPILPSPTSPIVEAPQRTPALEAASAGSNGGSDSSFNEKKSWKEKTFTEKRRTRVCWGCIPLWMVVTIVIVIVLCGAVIGGVVGGLLAAEKKGGPPTVTVTSTASMLDASPIPTPKGIAPIANGLYNMPFGIPQEQIKSCLTQQNQINTWACNTPQQPVIIRVGPLPSQGQFVEMFPNISMEPSPTDGPPRYAFDYGAQHPTISSPQRLFWVSDVEEPNRGPALHFQTMYDKLVILDDDQFSPMRRKVKRDRDEDEDDDDEDEPPFYSPDPTYTLIGDPYYATPTPTPSPTSSPAPFSSPVVPSGDFHHRKSSVSVGDQPWFCWWNQTWLEGFVYMNSFTVVNHNDPDKREAGPEPTEPPLHANVDREIKPRDADYAEAQEIWRKAIAEYGKRAASPPPTDSSSAFSSPAPTSSEASCFPYTMKMQERRIPCEQSVQPYCQKMLIPASGPPQPARDSAGNPIIVPISEDSASFKDQQNGIKSSVAASGNNKRDVQPKQLAELFRRDNSQNSCHCLWVSTPPTS